MIWILNKNPIMFLNPCLLIEPPRGPVFARIAAAIALGLAWGSGPDWLIAGAVLMPLVVLNARSRLGAFLLSLMYFGLAARGLPSGAATFFGSDAAAVITGAVLYLAAICINAAVWAAAWGPKARVLRALAALAATCLPPVGLIGWSHPLVAAGWLFPGAGLVGAFMTALLAASFLAKRMRWAGVLTGFAVASNVFAALIPSQNNSDFVGHSTEFGDASKVIFQVAPAIEKMAATDPKNSILLLPESTLGRLDEWKFEFLTGLEPRIKSVNQVAIIGAEVSDETRPDGYKNGLVVIGEEKPRFIEQRVPVPVSMWRPGSARGASADIFASGITTIKDTKVATLICYEQLLTFPALVSTAFKPQALLAASSAWWAKDTSIPKIQRASAIGWARLSRATAVLAVNF